MIDKAALRSFVDDRLKDSDYFTVDVTVGADNEIKVEIDSLQSVDIDFCVALSRAIEEAFPRNEEDYELEVGSAGLTSPLRVPKQYEKNIGNKVEVLTRDGRKLHGTLTSACESGFSIDIKAKEKPEGAKRPVEVIHTLTFPYADVKSVTRELEF